MAKARRNLVRQRAHGRCEYCQIDHQYCSYPHQLDHVRATKHHGADTMENTCFACAYCNGAKGSNVAGFDPESGELVRLFNPRLDEWREHFQWRGAELIGLTAIGRATIDVLRINDAIQIKQRQELIDASLFPPPD